MKRTYFLQLWVPRIFGIGVGLFLGLFALDAFETGKPMGRALVEFGIHLVPSAVILATVALAWRREWIGGVAFLALAAAYALSARSRLDWVLAISGPLLAGGALFLWSWSRRRRQQFSAG